MPNPSQPLPNTAATATSRRRFLKASTAAAALAGPGPLAGASVFAEDLPAQKARPEEEKVRLGLIGCGPQGHNSIRFTTNWFKVTAVADVDDQRRERSRALLSDGKAAAFNDYRNVLDRDDVDAVYIATPDHWHVKQLVEALRAGKDAYCEKPLTLTVDEGKLLRKVQKETGKIVQVGTQQRSMFDQFVKAIALVAEGRIGKIQSISAQIGGGPKSPAIPAVPAPVGLDWDRWLGPTPEAPYRFLKRGDSGLSNCFYNFRWWLEYSGGKLTDWGAHHVDIACWALRAAGQSDALKSIAGSGQYGVDFKEGFPVQKDRYNTPAAFNFLATMTDGVELTIKSDGDNGILFEGDKGRIFVNRRKLVGKPVEDLANDPLPEGAVAKVYRGFPMAYSAHKAHWMNFAHCLRERKEPISDVATHVRGLNICHLAGIAGRLGRKLNWDAEAGQITGDDQANNLLARQSRAGYQIA